MNNEALRKAFGEIGNNSDDIEKLVGDIFMNQPDASLEYTPNVGEIVESAIENAPKITCEINQSLILKFFNGNVEHEEWFSVMKHMTDCTKKDCRDLYDRVCEIG
jgi:hypothetical protein